MRASSTRIREYAISSRVIAFEFDVDGEDEEGEEIGTSPNSNFVSARMRPLDSAYSEASLNSATADWETIV